jgi:hypothetical protein
LFREQTLPTEQPPYAKFLLFLKLLLSILS